MRNPLLIDTLPPCGEPSWPAIASRQQSKMGEDSVKKWVKTASKRRQRQRRADQRTSDGLVELVADADARSDGRIVAQQRLALEHFTNSTCLKTVCRIRERMATNLRRPSLAAPVLTEHHLSNCRWQASEPSDQRAITLRTKSARNRSST